MTCIITEIPDHDVALRHIGEVADNPGPPIGDARQNSTLRIFRVCRLDDREYGFPYAKDIVDSPKTLHIHFFPVFRLIAFIRVSNVPFRHVGEITYHPYPISRDEIEFIPCGEVVVRRLNDNINRFPDLKFVIYGFKTFDFHFSSRSLITTINHRNIALRHVGQVAVYHNPFLWNLFQHRTNRIIQIGTVGYAVLFLQRLHFVVDKVPAPNFNLSSKSPVAGLEFL